MAIQLTGTLISRLSELLSELLTVIKALGNRCFFGVLGMSIDYRVKVPNSPAGGKS